MHSLHPQSKYPYGLSVNGASATPTITKDGDSGTGNALAVVLGADGRGDWGTANDAADANATQIAGPATLNVESITAEFSQAGSWKYDPATGLINYRGADATGLKTNAIPYTGD